MEDLAQLVSDLMSSHPRTHCGLPFLAIGAVFNLFETVKQLPFLRKWLVPQETPTPTTTVTRKWTRRLLITL